MRFNTAIKSEKKDALSFAMSAINRKKMVEIKIVRPRRSLSQNAYLHLIIGYFGSHFGYTMDEAKQVYKEVNSNIYRYEKKGRVFWRSSAELDKEEMAKSIDQFMQKSAENGCTLPPATDQEWLRSIENQIEASSWYLK